MCGLCSRKPACLSYQVRLSVRPDMCLCIAFPFTSTLGCGDVKGELRHSSTKPCTSPRFTWYTRVYYITLVWRY